MEIKCVVEKIDRDVNEIMNLKYPYLPEKYFKKYLENEDKFSKLGIIINDYLKNSKKYSYIIFYIHVN